MCTSCDAFDRTAALLKLVAANPDFEQYADDFVKSVPSAEAAISAGKEALSSHRTMRLVLALCSGGRASGT